jgi:hypothetical protein
MEDIKVLETDMGMCIAFNQFGSENKVAHSAGEYNQK